MKIASILSVSGWIISTVLVIALLGYYLSKGKKGFRPVAIVMAILLAIIMILFALDAQGFKLPIDEMWVWVRDKFSWLKLSQEVITIVLCITGVLGLFIVHQIYKGQMRRYRWAFTTVVVVMSLILIALAASVFLQIQAIKVPKVSIQTIGIFFAIVFLVGGAVLLKKWRGVLIAVLGLFVLLIVTLLFWDELGFALSQEQSAAVRATETATATSTPLVEIEIVVGTPAQDARAYTATETATPTVMPTPVPPTATPSATNTPLPTETPTSTLVPPTSTATPTAVPTNTNTPVPATATLIPTATATASATSTPVPPTLAPTATLVPTATATNTPTTTPTNTPVPTNTSIPTATPSPIVKATNTATSTSTPVPPTSTATNTPLPTSTSTPTVTPSSTVTSTPTATSTATPAPQLVFLLDDGTVVIEQQPAPTVANFILPENDPAKASWARSCTANGVLYEGDIIICSGNTDTFVYLKPGVVYRFEGTQLKLEPFAG